MYSVKLKITTSPPPTQSQEERKAQAEAEELVHSLTPASIMMLSLDPVRAQRTLMEIERLRGVVNLETPMRTALERSYMNIKHNVEQKQWEHHFMLRDLIGKEKRVPSYLSQFF